jgi:hypothetical protein
MRRDRPSLRCQNKERGLEGVLGILLVVQHAPAHVRHKGPVPPNQHRECRVVLPGREGGEQFAVVAWIGRRGNDSTEVLKDGARGCVGPSRFLRGGAYLSYMFPRTRSSFGRFGRTEMEGRNAVSVQWGYLARPISIHPGEEKERPSNEPR